MSPFNTQTTSRGALSASSCSNETTFLNNETLDLHSKTRNEYQDENAAVNDGAHERRVHPYDATVRQRWRRGERLHSGVPIATRHPNQDGQLMVRINQLWRMSSCCLPQTCAAACIPAPCPRARAYDRQAGFGTISSAKGEVNVALHDEVYLILADSLVADEQQVFADLIVAYQVPQQPNYVPPLQISI
jgi:hypothetical protein